MGCRAGIRHHHSLCEHCSRACPKKQSTELRSTSRKHAFRDKDCVRRWNILGTHGLCRVRLEGQDKIQETIADRR